MEGADRNGEGERIRVFIRARFVPSLGPDGVGSSSPYELQDKDKKLVVKDSKVRSLESVGEHSFSFDHVFWASSRQEEVFSQAVQVHVDQLIQGYNGCCFAYGQTGSGKTFTMFGEESNCNPLQRGMVPRALEYLFERLRDLYGIQQASLLNGRQAGLSHSSSSEQRQSGGGKKTTKKGSGVQVTLSCSFLEIYNNKVRDLGRASLLPSFLGESENKKSRSDVQRESKTMEDSGSTPLLRRPASFLTKTSDLYTTVEESMRGTFVTRPGLRAGLQRTPKSSGQLVTFEEEYSMMNYDIRELPSGEVFVENLASVPIGSTEDALRVIANGMALRATHETSMNAVSSRSHTVFTVHLLKNDGNGSQDITEVKSCLNLVDLAGSERVEKSGAQGQRFEEAKAINSSLTCLGDVIASLARNDKHVPFRNSKLTFLLKDSLTGNSKVLMYVAVSSELENLSETICSLNFAARCRSVALGRATRAAGASTGSHSNSSSSAGAVVKSSGYGTVYRMDKSGRGSSRNTNTAGIPHGTGSETGTGGTTTVLRSTSRGNARFSSAGAMKAKKLQLRRAAASAASAAASGSGSRVVTAGCSSRTPARRPGVATASGVRVSRGDSINGMGDSALMPRATLNSAGRTRHLQLQR